MTTEHGLKRHFDGHTAQLLGGLVHEAYPRFDVPGYCAEVRSRIHGKELKDRVLVLAEGLRVRLPSAYPDAVGVLVSILGHELDDGAGMFTTSWFLMPVARFVEEYGLAHPGVSIDAIAEITRRHTGEYAIRPYIEQHHDVAMQRIAEWALDPSPNLRRLASEGVRPRLPWARALRKFVADPRPVLDILEPLRADRSPFVRRSVANNLNDISRDSPALALRTAQRWSVQSPTAQTRWIVRRGLRTLVRKGDRSARQIVADLDEQDARTGAIHRSDR